MAQLSQPRDDSHDALNLRSNPRASYRFFSATLLSGAASFDKRASVDLYYVSILRLEAVQWDTKTANCGHVKMQNNSLIKNVCVRVRIFLRVRGRVGSLPVSVTGVYVVRETQTHTQLRRGVGLRCSSPALGHTVPADESMWLKKHLGKAAIRERGSE